MACHPHAHTVNTLRHTTELSMPDPGKDHPSRCPPAAVAIASLLHVCLLSLDDDVGTFQHDPLKEGRRKLVCGVHVGDE